MVLISAIRKMALAVPLLTFSSFSGFGQSVTQESKKEEQVKENLSLDSLREQCEALRNDHQRKPFKINIMCNGHYSILQQGSEEQRLLPTHDHVSTEVTSKGGRYSTGVQDFVSESLNSAVSCNKVTKTTIWGPKDSGIPVAIERCEDLRTESLEKICQTKIQEYCPDNMAENNVKQCSAEQKNNEMTAEQNKQEGKSCAQDQVQQQVPEAQGPQCTSTVEILDTCQMYKSHK